MRLSAVKPEIGRECYFDATNYTQKLLFIEYAAVIIFLLKFKVAYLPDYLLKYIDYNTDFSALYKDEEQTSLLRKHSSLMRQKSLIKQKSIRSDQDAEESKGDLKIVGHGKKEVRTKESIDQIYNETFDETYYDEVQTYKKQEVEDEDEYDEEEQDLSRLLIEK